LTSLTAELGAAAPVALLLIVIAAVLFRPGKLPEGAYAAAGGAVAVASGIVPAGQAGRVVAGTLGILGFFLGMIGLRCCRGHQSRAPATEALWR